MRFPLISLAIVTGLAACVGSDQAGMLPATDAEYEASPSEHAQIVAALQTVFDALARGDADLLRGVMHPSIVMTYSETSPDGITSFGSSTLDGLAARIEASEEPLIERMWDPVVRVSGAMASIWTPYDFYVGPSFSHCGVDTATLMDTDDGWKLVGLSWTRLQPPDCPLHPDGPPASR